MDAFQKIAYEKYKSGENIAILGPAGSGKSFIIGCIQQHASENKKICATTAMTGCAAVLLDCGASTLHSWAGIGLGNAPIEDLIIRIQKTPASMERWILTNILIIDEISMLTAELFELLDTIGRKIRKNQRLFGGIQLVLSGDFLQLPPVEKKTRFCFESPLWINLEQVFLKTLWRQQDEQWQTILNEIRVGECSPESCALLETRCIDVPEDLKIKPTKLYCRRADVDAINRTELDALQGDEQVWLPDIEIQYKNVKIVEFLSDYRKELVSKMITNFEKHAQYEKVLRLKVGAQVMLVVNLDTPNGLVNGSRGIIISMDGGLPTVEFANGLRMVIEPYKWLIGGFDKFTKIYRTHIPLRLAYALTIHKSQGMTLDSAEIDIGESVFEYGQTYVALSRVKNLHGLYLQKFDPSKIKAHPKALSLK